MLNAKAWKPISTVLSFPFKAGRAASWDNIKVFLAVYIDFLVSLEATIFYYSPKTTNEEKPAAAKSHLRQQHNDNDIKIIIC